jgi:hypothetical protein
VSESNNRRPKLEGLFERKPFVPMERGAEERMWGKVIHDAQQSALGIALAVVFLLGTLLWLVARRIWQDAAGSTGPATAWWLPVTLVLAGLAAGWGIHQFKRLSQYWYGCVEMVFALLSLLATGGKFIHSVHDSAGQWVAGATTVAAVYLVSRAFGNIAEGAEKRAKASIGAPEPVNPRGCGDDFT